MRWKLANKVRLDCIDYGYRYINVLLTRNGDQYELLIPLSDYNASELVDPTSLRESLRLYEEKLQFGLDSYNILPNNYEQFSMSTSTGKILGFDASTREDLT